MAEKWHSLAKMLGVAGDTGAQFAAGLMILAQSIAGFAVEAPTIPLVIGAALIGSALERLLRGGLRALWPLIFPLRVEMLALSSWWCVYRGQIPANVRARFVRQLTLDTIGALAVSARPESSRTVLATGTRDAVDSGEPCDRGGNVR